MKDPTSEIRDAYFTLLNGNVTVSGTAVPVYKWERPGDETRIEIMTATMDDDSTKDSYILNVAQEISVVSATQFDDQREISDEISSQVCELVTADTLMTMDSFVMHSATLSSTEVFEEVGFDNTLYRKDLVFEHKIEQK